MLRRLRKSITVLVFGLLGLLPAAAVAQLPSSPLVIKPDAPDRYTVVRGDTLWGIAERFTDSPWRWPDLWGMNQDQIRNPHLIYPGDVIVLDRALGRLRLAQEKPAPAEATKEAAKETKEAAPPAKPAAPKEPPMRTVRLSPHVRAEPLAGEGIPSIPLGIIEPFLARPLVVEEDELDKGPTIIATEGNRVMLSSGSTAYVHGLTEKHPAPNWYVYRKGSRLVDPDDNKTLGYEAIYLGSARVTRAGDPAIVQLSDVKQEILVGDKLVPLGPPHPLNYVPHAPAVKVKARVMSIYGGVSSIGEGGPYSIITVNRGRANGIEVGDVLALYRHGERVADTSKPGQFITVPDERYGLAFVFRIFEHVSYALVMRISMPVQVLDVAENP